MSRRTEVKDYKIRAYRIVNEGDQRFQNWRQASTVTLLLVAEIDGIEISLASETLAHSAWERQMKAASERPTGTTPAPDAAA